MERRDVLQIELIPDLFNCIEKVTKSEYEATLRQLLMGRGRSEELQERLELLRIFLETVDLKRLRQESEKLLLEGRTVKFVFYLENESPKYDMRVN